MLPIKLPEPSSRSPKPKQIPYNLPFEPTMHAAYSVQTNCGVYMWKRPVKATNRGQLWKEAEQLTSTDFFQRIHHCFNEIGASPRMRQEFAEYHAGKQARKQEKLVYKRQKKHPDDADHWTGQQWSQQTRNAGWVEGWHEPASSSSSRWHSQW